MSNKYDNYKDSGIEWIGEIPSHWDAKRIKLYSPVKRGASPRPIDDPKYFDDNGEYAWVRIADVTASDRYLFNTTQRLSELGASLSVKRHEGDFFLSIAGSVGKPMITKIKCCIHDGFVYFPNLTINPEFLYYIFQTGLPYLGLGKLGTQLNLNTETVGNIFIPIPSEGEIEIITNYLDQKTTQLEDLIAKKERLIQLLEEERTAIINQAVTKGLDPTVTMKDSGIEWLGEIPEHWEVILFKRVISKIKDGTHGTFQRLTHGYPFLSAKNVYNDGLKISEAESLISKNDYLDITKNGFPKRNDLLITCVGTIGRTFVYDLDEPIAFQRSVTFIRFVDNINPHYYKFYVQSSIYQNLLMSLAKTSAQSGIYMNDLLNTCALKIPLVEQTEIVEFLKTKTSEIDEIIIKTQREIELLKEYKTALISEVVTGKVDVRDEKLN